MKPRNIDPPSPMNVRAGLKLNRRNARQAPASAAARIAASARPSDAAMIAKVVAPMPTTPAASPSMPSVKLMMFTMATNQMTVST